MQLGQGRSVAKHTKPQGSFLMLGNLLQISSLMLTHTQTPVRKAQKHASGRPPGWLIDWVSEINVVNWMCFSALLALHWFSESSGCHTIWSGGFMCCSTDENHRITAIYHEFIRKVNLLTCYMSKGAAWIKNEEYTIHKITGCSAQMHSCDLEL